MKSTFTIIAVCLLAGSLATSADAATQRKNAGMAQLQAQCQAQAKKKYSAIHFLKRRAFVKSCMNQKA
jgi:negative regulator of sigma E activity